MSSLTLSLDETIDVLFWAVSMRNLCAVLVGLVLIWSVAAYKIRASLPTLHTRQTQLFSSPLYLERMVERKKIEVDSLLRRHQALDDPLVMRMSYIASECR